MGGSTTTEQKQDSKTDPWAPAQPMLQKLLGQFSNVNTGPTTAQTNALNQIESNAASAPDFTGSATNLANTLLSGGAPNQSGTVTDAYADLTKRLAPMASGGMIGKNQALQDQLDVAGNDITNQLEGQFAAAGRPVGTNAATAQAIARGVTQAQAPIIASQYNTDVANATDAAKTLYGAGTTTAGTVSGLNQQELANKQAGINVAGTVPGFLNQGANTVLQAEAQRTGIPLGILQQLTAMTGGIAGLGATSNSTGTTTQQQPIGPTLAGSAIAALPFLLPSDEKLKADIQPIGMLRDGQIVHRYRYKDDPAGRTHIGLLAQEVERWHPEAVHEIGGTKFVDYGAATAQAA